MFTITQKRVLTISQICVYHYPEQSVCLPLPRIECLALLRKVFTITLNRVFTQKEVFTVTNNGVVTITHNQEFTAN